MEFQEWAAERLGREEVERLRAEAKRPAKGLRKSLKDIAKHYRQQYEEMRLGGPFAGWEDGASASSAMGEGYDSLRRHS